MESILFVDDDSMATRMWRLALERAGYEVVLKTSVDEAADIFDGKRAFGVLIVDIMMPPGHFTADGRNEKGLTTGLEFIRFLREKKGIRTPMIVLTNTEDEEVLQRAESYPGVIVRDKLSELPSLLVETVRSLLTA